MHVEGEGREDYFIFCFHLDSIIVESDAQQTLPSCEWSGVCCSFGSWVRELKLVCLKKASKRWKRVLRFQVTQRRSLSQDLISSHFEIKTCFSWVSCEKKDTIKKSCFHPTSADSLCAVLILQCLMLIGMIQEEEKPLFSALKISRKYVFPKDAIHVN